MNRLLISSRIFRLVADIVSRAGLCRHLTILIYHRVLNRADPLQPGIVDADTFEMQLKLLSDCFQVIPLAKAVEYLRTNSLPARSACITFDDGYADNLLYALPLLQKYQLHATFFVATDYLDGGRMFNDTIIEAIRAAPAGMADLSEIGVGRYALSSTQERILAIQDILSKVKYLPWLKRLRRAEEIAGCLTNQPLPDDLMLSTEQLRLLHDSGMEIGAHTSSHPILAGLSDDEAFSDIERGKQRLEQILSTDIRLFAYPNGKPGQDYQQVHVAMLRELGFSGAVSTASGVATHRTDLYQLPRFSPWSRNRTKSALQLLRNLAQREPRPALLDS